MEWTRKAPTEGGWYWYHEHGDTMTAYVHISSDKRIVVWFPDWDRPRQRFAWDIGLLEGHWQGPIPEPDKPTEEGV